MSQMFDSWGEMMDNRERRILDFLIAAIQLGAEKVYLIRGDFAYMLCHSIEFVGAFTNRSAGIGLPDDFWGTYRNKGYRIELWVDNDE
jgi:hypothetical protein